MSRSTRFGRYGLSPLARGNHYRMLFGQVVEGPLPARAGEPSPSLSTPRGLRAYPRSSGGTSSRGPRTFQPRGLSPLARGNRPALRGSRPALGPIPARAGEPASCPPPAPDARAYPRSRGGTPSTQSVGKVRMGLSPLARGNPDRHVGHGAAFGPIPARAGEPAGSDGPASPPRAYPRSRGGTAAIWPTAPRSWGLSPLARGNRFLQGISNRVEGPIPARAGEPPGWAGHGALGGAYPRSRGGTLEESARIGALRGLSPLARGNPGHHRAELIYAGPIPARAGEPTPE